MRGIQDVSRFELVTKRKRNASALQGLRELASHEALAHRCDTHCTVWQCADSCPRVAATRLRFNDPDVPVPKKSRFPSKQHRFSNGWLTVLW